MCNCVICLVGSNTVCFRIPSLSIRTSSKDSMLKDLLEACSRLFQNWCLKVNPKKACLAFVELYKLISIAFQILCDWVLQILGEKIPFFTHGFSYIRFPGTQFQISRIHDRRRFCKLWSNDPLIFSEYCTIRKQNSRDFEKSDVKITTIQRTVEQNAEVLKVLKEKLRKRFRKTVQKVSVSFCCTL